MSLKRNVRILIFQRIMFGGISKQESLVLPSIVGLAWDLKD